MVSGNNGILTRATEAKEKAEEANDIERIQLAYNSVKMKKILESNNSNPSVSVEEVLSALNDNNYSLTYIHFREGPYSQAIKKGENYYYIKSNGKVERKIIVSEGFFKISYTIPGTTTQTVDENGFIRLVVTPPRQVNSYANYHYRNNMTWEEYINSDYNGSLNIFKKDSDEYVYKNFVDEGETYELHAYDKNNNTVKLSDKIISGSTYEFKSP